MLYKVFRRFSIPMRCVGPRMYATHAILWLRGQHVFVSVYWAQLVGSFVGSG